MAHTVGNGAVLSSTGVDSAKKQRTKMDVTDFQKSEDGGEPFAQCIMRIFRNSIDRGYKPRFISNACKRDQLWQCVFNDFLDDTYKGGILVYGAPYDLNDVCVLGFTGNKLSLISFGLIIDISEPQTRESDWYSVDTFALDDNLKQRLIGDIN